MPDYVGSGSRSSKEFTDSPAAFLVDGLLLGDMIHQEAGSFNQTNEAPLQLNLCGVAILVLKIDHALLFVILTEVQLQSLFYRWLSPLLSLSILENIDHKLVSFYCFNKQIQVVLHLEDYQALVTRYLQYLMDIAQYRMAHQTHVLWIKDV